MHWRCLSDQTFPVPYQQFVYEEYKRRIRELEELCKRLEAVLIEAMQEWQVVPIVEALQALHGIRLIAAATLVCEIGDMHRFDNPKTYTYNLRHQMRTEISLIAARQLTGYLS